MKKGTVLTCGILVFGLFAGICMAIGFDIMRNPDWLSDLIQKAPPSPRVGFRAPEIELVSIGGNTYRLSDYAGQPVVVNFWATWCPPCVAEIPEIQAAYSEYDFYLMAVNVGEDSGTTLQFAREMNMTFPVLLDTYGRVSNAYDVSSIPITFFIDAEGVIRQIERGSMSADVLYTDLQTIGVVP